jgi:hypothetical protein
MLVHEAKRGYMRHVRMPPFSACWHTGEVKIRLDGGNADGAVRVGDTVRRAAGPWTSAVHALLAHLAGQGFVGSPRPLGVDEQGGRC